LAEYSIVMCGMARISAVCLTCSTVHGKRWTSTPMTRLLSFSIDGRTSFGVVDAAGTGVVDLASRLPDVADLAALVAAGGLAEARAFEGEPTDHPLDAITFERPLTWPGKIFCIGVNYGGRAAEYDEPTDAAYPSVFLRFPDSFTGHDRDLIRPPESPQLDYEGEIVVVIGRGGRRIPVADARDHIAALTLGNEGTIRDWVRHAKFNVTQGKNWMATGAIGPWLVPIDEFGDLEQLHLTTRVNGELRQDDTPATMKYPIEYQVHYLSTFTDLRPGDLIFTGTPTGAGARFDPPIWLAPGDVVEVSVPGVGTLRNTVADEFAPGTREASFTAPEPR
jgi:2-keto-4-pentenoate hydratase/2-oxohepta-3-ene-1,7-dioic acid hydratase in catechol pathway